MDVNLQNTGPGLLLLGGLFLVVAGIIGGGIKLLGSEIDPLTSRDTRITSVAIGGVLIAASLFLGFDEKGHVHLRQSATRARTVLAFVATAALVLAGVFAFVRVTEPNPTAVGVPNVYGIPLQEARVQLEGARYAIGAIENVCSNSIRVPGVVRQVLAAGGRVVLVDAPPTGVTTDGKALAPGSALVLKVANGLGC